MPWYDDLVAATLPQTAAAQTAQHQVNAEAAQQGYQQQGLFGTNYEEQLRLAINQNNDFLQRLQNLQRNATPQITIPVGYRLPGYTERVKIKISKVKAIKRNLPDWW